MKQAARRGRWKGRGQGYEATAEGDTKIFHCLHLNVVRRRRCRRRRRRVVLVICFVVVVVVVLVAVCLLLFFP